MTCLEALNQRVEVQRAQAFVDQAVSDYERMKRLHTEEQVSDELLEKSATSLMLAEADLELAKIRLDELSVRAPFDGIVAERYIDLYERITGQTFEAELGDQPILERIEERISRYF